MNFDERICFFYHRTNKYNVTVAYQRDSRNSVTYGAAFCGPGDQFVKRFGREIASGRLSTVACAVDMSGTDGKRWEVHEAILESLNSEVLGYTPENFKI